MNLGGIPEDKFSYGETTSNQLENTNVIRNANLRADAPRFEFILAQLLVDKELDSLAGVGVAQSTKLAGSWVPKILVRPYITLPNCAIHTQKATRACCLSLGRGEQSWYPKLS